MHGDSGFVKRRQLIELRKANRRRRRRMALAKRVHDRGWRLDAEAWDEAARQLGEESVDRLLERFAGANPELLRALRVDELPISPLRVVPR